MTPPSATTWPEVLEPLEAAAFLRIADGVRSDRGALASLERLVASGKLRPVLIGGKRRYWHGELLRFLADETLKYQPIRPKGG